MTTEEVINQIRALVKQNDMNCAVAVQSDSEDRVSLCLHGDEARIAGCIVFLLGSGKIGPHNLGILGAYAIAQAKGLKGFEDAQKFADYLMGCAETYFRHSDRTNPNTRGLS